MASMAVEDLQDALSTVCSLPLAEDDAERIDRMVALERLASAVHAAQQAEMVAFEASQRAAQAEAGVPTARRGRGIAEQIGHALGQSPASAARALSRARVLCHDLRGLYGRLAVGEVRAWTADVVAREAAVLDPADRARLDAALTPRLHALSPRQAEAAARRWIAEHDAAGACSRAARARADRGVSIRPAPDTMAVVSALLPVEQGVALWAGLDQHARTQRATGDPRSLDQIRADTLVERATGQATAAAVPIEVQLTMPADTLLAGGSTATTVLDGLTVLPGRLARDLLTDPERRQSTTFVRRLFTDPIDQTAVAVDPRTRRFPAPLARLVRARDQHCRDPYCTATIRHLDHAVPHADGGRTDVTNGTGRCERGNYAKQAPGWANHVDPDGILHVTTPTGHTYTTRPPPLPVTRIDLHTPAEHRIIELIHAA